MRATIAVVGVVLSLIIVFGACDLDRPVTTVKRQSAEAQQPDEALSGQTEQRMAQARPEAKKKKIQITPELLEAMISRLDETSESLKNKEVEKANYLLELRKKDETVAALVDRQMKIRSERRQLAEKLASATPEGKKMLQQRQALMEKVSDLRQKIAAAEKDKRAPLRKEVQGLVEKVKAENANIATLQKELMKKPQYAETNEKWRKELVEMNAKLEEKLVKSGAQGAAIISERDALKEEQNILRVQIAKAKKRLAKQQAAA